jgi:hypothetical protein
MTVRRSLNSLVVDVHDARVEPAGQGDTPVVVGGDDPGRAVAGVVGPADGLVGVVDRGHGGHGAEGLLPGQLGVVGDVGQQGGGDDVALAVAAGQDPGALLDGPRDAAAHPVGGLPVDQRADDGVGARPGCRP